MIMPRIQNFHNRRMVIFYHHLFVREGIANCHRCTERAPLLIFDDDDVSELVDSNHQSSVPLGLFCRLLNWFGLAGFAMNH